MLLSWTRLYALHDIELQTSTLPVNNSMLSVFGHSTVYIFCSVGNDRYDVADSTADEGGDDVRMLSIDEAIETAGESDELEYSLMRVQGNI